MTLAEGLAAFLEEKWERPVKVSGLTASSAGARRANVAFDAEDGERTLPLVATVVPSAAVQINPVRAEVAVRTLAREGGVPTC